MVPSTRWSTTLSSKVNFLHAIHFGALMWCKFGHATFKMIKIRTLELHRVVTMYNGSELRCRLGGPGCLRERERQRETERKPGSESERERAKARARESKK